MASWSGFTEEDLHRLKRDVEINSIDKQKIRNGKQQRASADVVATKDQKKIRAVQQNRRKMPLVQEKVGRQIELRKSIHRNKAKSGITMEVRYVLLSKYEIDIIITLDLFLCFV